MIPFETIEESDPNITIGDSVTKQTGDYGISESEYIVTYVNGVETSRKLVKRSTIKEPIIMIISVGSKKPTPEEDIAASKKAFALINDYRESKGLSRIIWNDGVYQMALIRSKELLEMFSHTRPDGSYFNTVGYVIIENLAGGQKHQKRGFQRGLIRRVITKTF